MFSGIGVEKPDKPLGPSQVEKGVIGQKRLDEFAEVGTDPGGDSDQPGVGVLMQDGLDILGKVIPVGMPFGSGDQVLFDELPVVVVDGEDLIGGPDPHADVAHGMGHGEELTSELHVVVGMDPGAFPDGDFKGIQGQWPQEGALHLLEEWIGWEAGSSVGLLPILFDQPVADTAVEGVNIGLGIDGQQLLELLADGLDIALDLGLVLGSGHPAGIQEAAVEPGHLLIGAVEVGVIEIGLDHAAFEVVEADPGGNTAEKLEHVDMRGREALLVLLEGELHELVPAVGQGGDEGVEAPLSALLGIEEQPHLAIVDLDQISGFGFDPAGTGRLGGLAMGSIESLEGGIADPAGELMALADDLEGELRFQRPPGMVDQGLQFFGIGQQKVGDACSGGTVIPVVVEEGLEGRRIGQGLFAGDPTAFDVLDRPADRLAIEAQGPGDVTDGMAGMPAPGDFIGVLHANPLVCHGALLCAVHRRNPWRGNPGNHRFPVRTKWGI